MTLTVRNKRYALLLLFVDSVLLLIDSTSEWVDGGATAVTVTSFDFLSFWNCSRKNRRILSLRSKRSLYGESVTI